MNTLVYVITANSIWAVLYTIAWVAQFNRYRNKLNDPSTDAKELQEYFLAGQIGLTPLMLIGFTLIRNNDVFNNGITDILFIIQFVAQLGLLIFVADYSNRKFSRFLANFMFLIIMGLVIPNGLFKKIPKYNPVEVATMELNKLTGEIEELNDGLSERIKKVNEGMNFILKEMKEREQRINTINDVLKEKESKNQELTNIIQINTHQAEEILTILNVKPPTFWERIQYEFEGLIMGYILLGIFYLGRLTILSFKKNVPE